MGKIRDFISDGFNMLKSARGLDGLACERWEKANQLRPTDPRAAARLEQQANRLVQMGFFRRGCGARVLLTETWARHEARRQERIKKLFT